MGEKITITAIKIIEQSGDMANKTLLQIDLWFTDQDKGGRTFIDSTEFFNLLNASAK